jgi:hypothetical protein
MRCAMVWLYKELTGPYPVPEGSSGVEPSGSARFPINNAAISGCVGVVGGGSRSRPRPDGPYIWLYKFFM